MTLKLSNKLNDMDGKLFSTSNGHAIAIGRGRIDLPPKAINSPRSHTHKARSVTLAVRPERIELAGPADVPMVSAVLRDVVYSGQSLLLITQLEDGQTLRARIASRQALAGAGLGERLNLTWRPDAMQVFIDEDAR